MQNKGLDERDNHKIATAHRHAMSLALYNHNSAFTKFLSVNFPGVFIVVCFVFVFFYRKCSW